MTTEAQHRAARKARAKLTVLRTDPRGDRTGTVPVTCWCEADIVRLPIDQVGVTTASCGRPGCREPLAA